jgi:hypothetical protein
MIKFDNDFIVHKKQINNNERKKLKKNYLLISQATNRSMCPEKCMECGRHSSDMEVAKLRGWTC